MTYVYPLDGQHNLAHAELTALIGGKAANLSLMTTELRLPVPPGFAITTEACRAYLARSWPEGLDDELNGAMRRLESAVGRRFGDAKNPLLVSVRSGAPVSMPGMMDTILNLGLNDETTDGLAAASRDARFAADCRRRLQEMFTKTVGVATVPDDPWRQLRAAIEAVFRSWNSERARAYRVHERIADDLGTAVTVQAMVFGNWGDDSATGVLFTRNPATGEPVLYGDLLFASQGEDVVAGTHRTQPVTVLDSRLPRVGAELRRFANSLERYFADLCDIEFTIEQGKLWLLQVRVGKRSPRAALRMAVDMAEDPGFPLSRAEAVHRVAKLLADPPVISTRTTNDMVAIATGLPASPGVAAGEIATSPEAAVKAFEAGRQVILVRSETSPDDVQGMARAAGVLTSRGGLASHAAVVARGWGIPAVVGAAGVSVGDRSIDVGGRILQAGETITIDGGTGEVFAGAISTGTAVVPEAAKLLDWAKELGIDLDLTPPPITGEVQRGGEAKRNERPGSTTDDVIRALLIKGSATTEALADGLLSSRELIESLLQQLVDGGLVESAAGLLRLTGHGTAKGQQLIAVDTRRWGAERAQAALDDFHALDQRMKEAVTAWQLREVGGAQVLNDHSDAEHDATVLAKIAGLHEDATAWLSSMNQGPPQLGRYLERLTRAIASVHEGDHRFVASPRVDSYHSVWFELHEELILLAGRTRDEEAAAGRA